MKTVAFVALAALLLVLASSACRRAKRGPQTLRGAQTGATITVPDGWEPAQLNPTAEIGAQNRDVDAYLFVKSERTSELKDVTDLESYAAMVLRRNAERMPGKKSERIGDLTINGRRAIQFLESGPVGGLEARGLMTLVEGDGTFFMLVGWSDPARWAASRPVLEGVIRSFELPRPSRP